MKDPTWDIMIASLEHRHEKLQQLLDVLCPQLGDGVGVLIYRDNRQKSIGYKRQVMLDSSTADYVCACDDDDMVTENYVELTRKALRFRPDYVGWEQIFYDDGVKQKRVFHSLRYDTWTEDENGYYRGITHSNPIRRELALLARFDSTNGGGEDFNWSAALTKKGVVETEVWLNTPVHIAYHDWTDCFLVPAEPVTDEHPPLIERPHVRYVSGG